MGTRLSRAIILGAGAGLLLAGGLVGYELWERTGPMVVTSDPPGAAVAVDGKPAGRTPAVVDGLHFREPHQVQVTAPDRRPFTQSLPADWQRTSARIHAALPSALGDLVIDSEPPGAEVRIDGKVVGQTPLTVPGVRLDHRHRIDLSATGREIDQFVVLPEKDGLRFRRKLPAPRAPAGR